ncbi:MAG: fibronectin type III domain-containing protein [Candidatus Kryptoniota bacterium]
MSNPAEAQTPISPADGSPNVTLPVTFTWNSVTNATSYELIVATDNLLQSRVVDEPSLPGTSSAPAGLLYSTQYYWEVQADSSTGTSDTVISSSQVVSFTTLAPPPVPSLVSPANDSTNAPLSVTLSWSASTNADSYQVELSTSSGFTSMVLNDSATTSTSVLTPTLSPGTIYYWQVRAINAAGLSDFSTTFSFTTLSLPSVPTLVSPDSGLTNQPLSNTLSWSTSSNAASYQVELSTSSGFTSTVINDSATASTSIPTGALSTSTTYYWRVRAINAAGLSSFSTAWSFTTLPPIPGVPVLVSPDSSLTNQPLSNTLSWSTSSNAASYQVELSTSSIFTSTIINDSATASTSIPTGALSTSTTYYWRVRAINAAGLSSFSTVWSFTTLPPIPGVPSLVSPVNGSTNVPLSDLLSWGASTNAASYQVELSTSSNFASTIINDSAITSTSVATGTLSASTTYYWQVRAINAAGLSGFSTTFSFTTLTPVTAPSVPTLVSPLNGSTNQPLSDTLTWSPSSNASRYQVEVSTSSSFSSTIINDSTVTSTSRITGTLTGNTTYYWRVQSVNSVGSSGWSSVWSFTTLTPLPPPSVPSLVSPLNGSTKQPLSDTLSWSASTSASRYQVELSTSSGFSSTIINDSAVTTTSKTTGTLTENTTYYWRVQAINSAGSSGWSSVWSFTTLTAVTAPSVPSLISPLNGSTNQPLSDTLNWGASTNASRYQVELSTSSSFASTIINDSTITSTSRITGTLSGSTTYYWRVQAINSAGSSGWSNIWNFTTLTSLSVPSVPSLVSPLNGATNLPLDDTLSWGTSLNATHYQVEVSDSSSFSSTVINDSTITSTSRTTGALSEGTLYYWRVQAINAAGSSGWSTAWNFSTLTPVILPTVPFLISPPNGSTNQPLADTLSWNPSPNASHYQVEVSTSPSFSSTIINDLTITSTSKITGALSGSTPYYWRVQAINSAGSSGWSNIWSFTTLTPVTVPTVPLLVSPLNGSTNQPISDTLNWNSSQNVSRYQVEISTSSTFGSTIIDDSTITSTSKITGALSGSTTYYWRVQALNSVGSSGWSNVWSFTTLTQVAGDTIIFPSYSTASQFKPTDYRLVGIPGASNMQIASILHGTPGKDWQAYWDNGAATNYLVQYDSSSNFRFTIGRAFWIIKNGPLIIDTTVQSAPLDSANSVEIPLHNGWNIITDPFSSSVPWSMIQSLDSTTELLYSFNEGFETASSLIPGVGFYFFNSKNLATLEIPFNSLSKMSAVAAKRSAAVEYSVNENWNVHMVLASTGATDSVAWFGVSSQVDASHNFLDVHRPRGIGFVPAVYFQHAEWDSNYNIFASEIHPVFSDSSEWNFKVDASPSHTATIKFIGLDQIPSNFDVYLFDASRNSWIDMRSSGSYSFVPSASTTSFELLVGKDNLIKRDITNPTDFEVGNNYPNPFNPSTTIPVYIFKEANIKIEVYNVIGQKVAEVYNGDASAGQHLFKWNGTDGIGRELSSGIYLYRVSASLGYSVTHKMVFIK